MTSLKEFPEVEELERLRNRLQEKVLQAIVYDCLQPKMACIEIIDLILLAQYRMLGL